MNIPPRTVTCLEQIPGDNPNPVHIGQTTLVRHSTTNQGDYLMLDNNFEAVVIDPRTQRIRPTAGFEPEEDPLEAWAVSRQKMSPRVS